MQKKNSERHIVIVRVVGFTLVIFAMFMSYQNCGGGHVSVRRNYDPTVNKTEKVNCEQLEVMQVVASVDRQQLNVGETINFEVQNANLYATLLLDFGDGNVCDVYTPEESPGVCEVQVVNNLIKTQHTYSKAGNFLVKFQAVDQCYFGKVDFKKVCVRANPTDACSTDLN